MKRVIQAASVVVFCSLSTIGSGATQLHASAPQASALMKNDPSLPPCTNDGTACAYDSITTNHISGVTRDEDTKSLWGSPRKSYPVHISGKLFSIVPMSSDRSVGPSGIVIYEPGNPRHIAAFREISVVQMSGIDAIGEALWARDPVIRLYALTYDSNEHTIVAKSIGSKPNCRLKPPAEGGVVIGECRRFVHDDLYKRFPIQASSAAAQPFRASERYQYSSNDSALYTKMKVVAHQSDAQSDSISFIGALPDSRLRDTKLRVYYADGTVKKVTLHLDLWSNTREIAPEDLINGPSIFPPSLQTRYLARGKAQPQAVNAHAATIFLYRSEHGEFVIHQSVSRTIRDDSGLPLYYINADIQMVRRAR